MAGHRGDSSLTFVFMAALGALVIVGVVGLFLGGDDGHAAAKRSKATAGASRNDAARKPVPVRGRDQTRLNAARQPSTLPALSERPAWESLLPHREAAAPSVEPPDPPSNVTPVEPQVPNVPSSSASTLPADSQLLADLDRHMEDLLRLSELPVPVMEVQHILIGFVKSDGGVTVPGKPITRTQAEAKLLVAKLLHRAKTENFDALVREFTEDSHPGIYGMHGHGSSAEEGQRLLSTSTYPRNGMVPVFGNCGWRLRVGEVGVLDYDAQSSPYGWHIVKRIR